MKPLLFPSFLVAAGMVFTSASGGAIAQQTAQLDERRREALTAEKRDETIEQLRRILTRIDERSPQRPDLLYQLAELYVEKSRQLLKAEMSEYDEQYARYQQARQRGDAGAEPQASHKASEQFRAEAIALYDRIRLEHPGYRRKDEVLFALAESLYEIGRKVEAVARYEELIRSDPNSAFLGDAYLQLGNHYFDEANDLARARHYYQKALGSELPKVHSYALYKLAWCDYNAGDFENALKKLQQVVVFAQRRGREMIDLRNEALGDLPAVFVHLGRFPEALDYFQRAVPEMAVQRKLILRLANQLAETGQYENAIRSYRHLIARNPADPAAPEFQRSIIRCYEEVRDRARVKSEMRKLVDSYRPGGEWWKANEGRPEILRNAFAVSEEAMRTLAVDYHQEAQRTKQVETYRLARDIYAQYLDAFASSTNPEFIADQALNMRFYYAEILWALEDWEGAAKAYEEVIAFKVPDRPSAREVSDEKLRQSAAYNVVLAYDKLLKIDRGELAKSALKAGQMVAAGEKAGLQHTTIDKKSSLAGAEEPLSRHEAHLVAACDRYNRLYPGEADEVELQYLAAITLYRRRHFDEAVGRFEQIALRWPDDSRSQPAADLAMHVLETREQWRQLNALGRRFLADARLTKRGTEFAQRVANVVEGSQYKWIDEVIYRQEKNPAKAAQEFIRLANEFPHSKYTAQALTYAVVAFGEAHQISAGIAAGERMLKEAAASPFALKVRFTLARYYEKVADFQKAAQMYESFVAAYDRRAAKALSPRTEEDDRSKLLAEAENWLGDAAFNAGLWWEALGRYERAIVAYSGYLARFKDSKDAPEVKFGLGSLFEKSGQWSEALKTYREFEAEYAKDKRVSSSRRFLVKYRRLLSLRKLGRGQEADRLLDELLREYQRLKSDTKKRPDLQEAYASLRFWKVEPLWKEYSQLRLNRLSTLRGDLQNKRRKLGALEKSYTEVLSVGSAEHGIAALTRIGLAFLDLAQNISSSPNPRGLSREQLEMYRAELKNLSGPLEGRAVEVLDQAVAKASQLGVYNDWLLAAEDAVNRVRPGAYAKVRRVPYEESATLAMAPLQREDGAIAAADLAGGRKQMSASPGAAPAEANEGR